MLRKVGLWFICLELPATETAMEASDPADHFLASQRTTTREQHH